MSWDYWQEPIDGTFRIREPIGDANRRIIGHVLREDDARLIVAAPKLFEACASVWAALAGHDDPALAALANECRAAISVGQSAGE